MFLGFFLRSDWTGIELGIRGQDLGAWHLHRQREEELPPQDYGPQQVHQDQSQWKSFLFSGESR